MPQLGQSQQKSWGNTTVGFILMDSICIRWQQGRPRKRGFEIVQRVKVFD